MDYDVTVHITPNTDGSFFVTGTTTGRRGGGPNKHDCPDAKALRGFLSGDLGIRKREADAAMASVSKVGSGTYPIAHVTLTAEQITAHGLGPI
jgi:hypothetical protein